MQELAQLQLPTSGRSLRVKGVGEEEGGEKDESDGFLEEQSEVMLLSPFFFYLINTFKAHISCLLD